MRHVLNVLYPGTKKGNVYAGAYVFLTRTHVLLTRVSSLTLSLSWFTVTRVLLTPHLYKGPLPKHEAVLTFGVHGEWKPGEISLNVNAVNFDLVAIAQMASLGAMLLRCKCPQFFFSKISQTNCLCCKSRTRCGRITNTLEDVGLPQVRDTSLERHDYLHGSKI